MAEHYTLNTVSVAAYCPKCRRETQHRVDGRRKGPCMVCMERMDVEAAERAKQTPPATQDRLF